VNTKSERKAISPKGGSVIPVPGPGRRKGSKNKLSKAAKENIAAVFEVLGGVRGMATWAKRTPRNMESFYRDIYPKILALDVSHSGEVAHVLSFDFGSGENGKV